MKWQDWYFNRRTVNFLEAMDQIQRMSTLQSKLDEAVCVCFQFCLCVHIFGCSFDIRSLTMPPLPASSYWIIRFMFNCALHNDDVFVVSGRESRSFLFSHRTYPVCMSARAWETCTHASRDRERAHRRTCVRESAGDAATRRGYSELSNVRFNVALAHRDPHVWLSVAI